MKKETKKAKKQQKRRKSAEIGTKPDNFLLKRGDLGKISDRKSGESGNLSFKNSGSRKECGVAHLGILRPKNAIFCYNCQLLPFWLCEGSFLGYLCCVFAVFLHIVIVKNTIHNLHVCFCE